MSNQTQLNPSDFYFQEYEGIFFIVTKSFYDENECIDDQPQIDPLPILPKGFYRASSAGFSFDGAGGRRKARKLLKEAGFADADALDL